MILNGRDGDILYDKQKIYVSPYASEWFYDVVNIVVKKYGVKAAVTRSTMKEKPFY